MDDYSLNEVKDIIKEDNLSANILRSILDNTTRRIEIYNDDESVEILKYILENAEISEDVKSEINKYLDLVSSVSSEVVEEEKNKVGNLFLIFLVLLFVVFIIVFLLSRWFMTKLSNDQNINNLKYRERLRIYIMIMFFLTVVLAIMCIFLNVNIIFPIITYLYAKFLVKKRDSVVINRKDDLKEFRDAIKKNKKKYRRSV